MTSKCFLQQFFDVIPSEVSLQKQFKCIRIWFRFYSNRGLGLELSNYFVFLSLNSIFILANSADPDEMPLFAASYLYLYCLSIFPFTAFPLRIGLMHISPIIFFHWPFQMHTSKCFSLCYWYSYEHHTYQMSHNSRKSSGLATL